MTSPLRRQREKLRLSQSALSRMSGLPRLRITLHELGDRLLTEDEMKIVRASIRKEAARLRRVLKELLEGDQRGNA